jgi:hypothetical protein
MKEQDRGPRSYPHGSGDRNTMDSSDIRDANLGNGGTQRKPTESPPDEPGKPAQ